MQSIRRHLAAALTVAVVTTLALPATASTQSAPAPVQQTPRPPAPEPSERIVYGEAPSQFIEVYRPSGPGPYPVAIFIHGGCYVTREASVRTARRMGADLAQHGVVAWNIAYRRTDEEGAAFPGLFQDIATATDRVRAEANRLNLDLSKVVIAGHSAGGHLALWSAGRPNIPATSPLHSDTPLRPAAVVGIAGPGMFDGMQPLLDNTCGADTFVRLVGAPSAERPDLLADTSPDRLLPFGVPVRLLVGSRDQVVPPVFVDGFAKAATAAGDAVDLTIIEGADHIDPVDVRTDAWVQVRTAILTAVGR